MSQIEGSCLKIRTNSKPHTYNSIESLFLFVSKGERSETGWELIMIELGIIKDGLPFFMCVYYSGHKQKFSSFEFRVQKSTRIKNSLCMYHLPVNQSIPEDSQPPYSEREQKLTYLNLNDDYYL